MQQCVLGVSCGMGQVPHVNFFEHHSLLVNDITFCIPLHMVIDFGYSAKVVNVETTLLYGELEEEIYIECSQGMSDVGKDDFIN